MNEALESMTEYAVLLEEADRLEDEPLEIACENKLGYIALCASCPLVAMFGECPKEIRNDIVTPEFDGDELIDADFIIDSGVDFGVQVHSEIKEASIPLIQLPEEPAKQITIPAAVSEGAAPNPQNNRAVEQAVKPEALPEKPVARSYLELLFDDSISVVVAPMVRPRKKEVVKQKRVAAPIQQISQSPIVLKNERRPVTATKKPTVVVPTVHEQPIEEVVAPEPSPTPFVVELPKKRTEVLKNIAAHEEPEVKPVSVTRQINPPKQKITPVVTSLPAKSVNKPKPVVITPIVPEILQPLVAAPAMLFAEGYDNKLAPEITTVSQPVEEMAAIEVEAPVQVTTATIEPRQEDQDPEIELPIAVVTTDEDARGKLPFLEEQFAESDDRQDTVAVPDTPEVLIENTTQPVGSILRNIKLLLGSFVLKITL